LEHALCMHQCKRCGVLYSCVEANCGYPFDSGYCNICSPIAIEITTTTSYATLTA
jgi:hypothetical protein